MSNCAKAITFWFRLVIFLITPLLYFTLSAAGVAIIIIPLLILSLAIDFISGRTLWFPTRTIPLIIMAVYLIVTTIELVSHHDFTISTFLVMLLLLVALSSDAISDSSRWKSLTPIGIISIIVVKILLFKNPENTAAAAFPALPLFASVLRIFFPRTKHLLHTSLDYRYLRVEILSFGMKRAIAAGIRKHQIADTSEQTPEN